MKASVKLAIFAIFVEVFLIEPVYLIATVKWTNAICESRNQSWVIIEECRLRAISRNKTILNVNVNLLYPVHVLHLNLRMVKRANGYKPWLGDYTVDFCAFMLKTNHPAIKVFWDVIKDFTNFGHPCPFVGNQILKNMFWDARNFSLPFPSGDYGLFLTFLFNMKPAYSVNVYFTFTQDFFKD